MGTWLDEIWIVLAFICSAIFFSREATVSRLRATSKIAPHEFDALAKIVLLPL